MGRKRLPKWHSIIFHLTFYIKEKADRIVCCTRCRVAGSNTCYIAVGSILIILLSGCQSTGLQTYFKQPAYDADYQHIEKILHYVDQEKYKIAFEKNEKLERRYDGSENVNHDYSQVILISARMNAAVLRKILKDKKNHLQQVQKIEKLKFMNKQMDLTKKNLDIKIDKLTNELNKSTDKALKTVERLKSENKILQQQIENFKKIDLQKDKNITPTQ